MNNTALLDGRYHWLRSHNAFKERLKLKRWDRASDSWLATTLGFNTQDIHNLKTKVHKYRAMEKIADVFSPDGSSPELTVYPVIIYLDDQILLPEQLTSPPHQYVGNVLDKRVSDLEEELRDSLKEREITIEMYIAEELKDRSFLPKSRTSSSVVKRYLNIKPGSPTNILDALAMVMGLHLAYYSESVK